MAGVTTRGASNVGRWELWGPLRERYEARAKAGGPYRVLSLDGGGIRGVLTLPVLIRMEELLRAKLNRGPDFRLCEFFDCVGGTSTGSIIATAIAQGKSATELLDFYKEFGNAVFKKRNLFERWKSLYEDGALKKKLEDTFGASATLEPHHLRCLLIAVTRNATTDSCWPISSNPWASYNDPGRPDCNLKVPAWRIVRASTAAPVYFPPEVIQWDPRTEEKSFVFVDGGTTSYNNPAFLLARMVMEPAYQLGWPRGERNLLVVSVGTGSWPTLGKDSDDPESNLAAAVTNTLKALMRQALVDQDMACRTMGRCSHGLPLDREIGDLIPRDDAGRPVPLDRDLGRAFLYARYDAELTRDGLRALGVPHLDPSQVTRMDKPEFIPQLEEAGKALAREVTLDHFGSFVGR